MKSPSSDRHDKDKVLMSWRVKPEQKALALLVADKVGCRSLVDVYQLGLELLATSNGILKNGVCTDDYRIAMTAIANQIRDKKRNDKRRKVAE